MVWIHSHSTCKEMNTFYQEVILNCRTVLRAGCYRLASIQYIIFRTSNCLRTANIAPPKIINSPLPFIIQNRSEYILLTSLRLPLRAFNNQGRYRYNSYWRFYWNPSNEFKLWLKSEKKNNNTHYAWWPTCIYVNGGDYVLCEVGDEAEETPDDKKKN